MNKRKKINLLTAMGSNLKLWRISNLTPEGKIVVFECLMLY